MLGDPPTEKLEELWSDRTARMLGYEVVRLSQPRRSMVSVGLPDRLYLHPIHKLAVWAELKSEKGKLSPKQKAFHQMLQSSGQTVVWGPANAVGEALVSAIKHRRQETR